MVVISGHLPSGLQPEICCTEPDWQYRCCNGLHLPRCPPQEDQQRAMRDPTYRGVVSTYVVAYWAALLGSCYLAATHHVPALAQAGLVLSLGSSAGITFAVAHELVHRHVACRSDVAVTFRRLC